MYVCMYVCMYACMCTYAYAYVRKQNIVFFVVEKMEHCTKVCVCLCMYVYIFHMHMYVHRISFFSDRKVNIARRYVCMYVCMHDVCMYVCMYVCVRAQDTVFPLS